jgi:hypothetical protein
MPLCAIGAVAQFLVLGGFAGVRVECRAVHSNMLMFVGGTEVVALGAGTVVVDCILATC